MELQGYKATPLSSHRAVLGNRAKAGGICYLLVVVLFLPTYRALLLDMRIGRLAAPFILIRKHASESSSTAGLGPYDTCESPAPGVTPAAPGTAGTRPTLYVGCVGDLSAESWQHNTHAPSARAVARRGARAPFPP